MKKLSKILFVLCLVSLFMAAGAIDGGNVSLHIGMVWGGLSVIMLAVFGYTGELYSKERLK